MVRRLSIGLPVISRAPKGFRFCDRDTRISSLSGSSRSNRSRSSIEVAGGLSVRFVFSILIVAVTIMVISALSAMGAGPMRIGVPSPSVSYFPAIVAWKKGFFAQEGIQAEFIVMRPSIIPAALTNGEIHFSTALMLSRRFALQELTLPTLLKTTDRTECTP